MDFNRKHPMRESPPRILSGVSRTIVEARKVRATLRRFVELALRATRADRCAIFTPPREARSRLFPLVVTSGIEADTQDPRPKSREIERIETEVDSRQQTTRYVPHTVTFEDAVASLRIPARKTASRSKYVAFLPVRGSGPMCGLLAVDHKKVTQTSDSEKVDLFDANANGAGQSLRSAELVGQIDEKVAGEHSPAANNQSRQISEAVLNTSNLRVAIGTLNRTVCRDLRVKLEGITFRDSALRSLLGARDPSITEVDLLRSWRPRSPAAPVVISDQVFAPILISGRVAGLMRLRSIHKVDDSVLQFAELVAEGLGNVAHKAKMKSVAEQRRRDMDLDRGRDLVARDLHDALGQTLLRMGHALQELIEHVDNPEVRGGLENVRGLAAQSIIELRESVYSLAVLQMQKRSLVESVRKLLGEFRGTSDVSVELRVGEAVSRLSVPLQVALFRVIYEALVNVNANSRATGVVIHLDATTEEISLTIRDDGVDLDQRVASHWNSSPHFGLRTMAQTIEDVGGRFTVTSCHPRGLRFEAVVPVLEPELGFAKMGRSAGVVTKKKIVRTRSTALKSNERFIPRSRPHLIP